MSSIKDTDLGVMKAHFGEILPEAVKIKWRSRGEKRGKQSRVEFCTCNTIAFH